LDGEETPMNDKQARDVATKLMAKDPPGTEIWLNSEGMAINPHGNPPHTDAYRAWKLPNGQVVVRKEHVPNQDWLVTTIVIFRKAWRNAMRYWGMGG
jgi:hypothetical protein